MAVQRLSIQEFLERSKNNVLLDVRSPGEYVHACMPGAVSLPLFTDEERKVVGTAYKQESREQAIKTGLDFFGPKMRTMVEEVEELLKKQTENGNKTTEVFIYCWRGGMRSSAVAWLLDLYGFKVCTLAGGYKAFRNFVLRSFEGAYSFKILGGYTGSGKTEVLQQLEKMGEVVIDLEAIACHKGSAFGAYKMPKPPTQEMFENVLSGQLIAASSRLLATNNESPIATDSSPITHYSSFIWLEDESQRIGNLNLPNALWQTMRSSPLIFLEIDFGERLTHLAEEYKDCDIEMLIESTRRIAKRLGPLETKTTLEMLEKGDKKEAFRVLLHYYDKRYLKGLHNRENLSALITKIQCQKVTPQNANLVTKHQPV